jgi:mRNA export factor
MWSLATNQSTVVARHDAPVRHCFFVPQLNNMLVTGSWDRTLKYWDCRQPTPVHTQALPDRVHAMDVAYPLAVVGTANRRIQVFNLTNPATPYKDIESPLKFQTRCVACFPDTMGYLVGSIEGRVAVQHVEDALQTKNFTFKCHREGADIYAVDSIAFHPQFGTFVTTGADGAYNFWDKDSKQRLKAMAKANAPIPCGVFNMDGSIYAYAVCSDWSHGHAGHDPAGAQAHILLHPTQEAEVKNRARTAKR